MGTPSRKQRSQFCRPVSAAAPRYCPLDRIRKRRRTVAARSSTISIVITGATRGRDRSRNASDVQAWRPGDGATVARALGETLRALTPEADDEEDREPELCFQLDLIHSEANSSVSGKFLSAVGRRRRTGGGVLASQDRWMTETARRPGEIVVPRLRWAKRSECDAPRSSHLALAFDIFETKLATRKVDELGASRPLHGFGLSRALERNITYGPDTEWIVYAPPKTEGEKAPDNRTGIDRLLRMDAAIARATARFLGGGADEWPVLTTSLPAEARSRIDQLHDHSDWVVTVDRNACVEYFDAPVRLPEVYRAVRHRCNSRTLRPGSPPASDHDHKPERSPRAC